MDPMDDAEGVAMDVLILGAPNFLTSFIYNCVQMQVSVSFFGVRRVSEEVAKDGEVDLIVVDGGRRLYGGSGNGGRCRELTTLLK